MKSACAKRTLEVETTEIIARLKKDRLLVQKSTASYLHNIHHATIHQPFPFFIPFCNQDPCGLANGVLAT